MAKSKRSGAGHGNRYKAYLASRTYEKNRARRLARAIKRNPENPQLLVAAKDINYRRSTPKNKEWSASKRALVTLYKLFTGKVNMEMFHTNPKISAAALMTPGWKSADRPAKWAENRMFSIGVRLGGTWN